MWIYHNPHGMTQESIAKRTFSTKQVIQAIVKTYMKKEYYIWSLPELTGARS